MFKNYLKFLTSEIISSSSFSFQGTFSLIIEAWNAESPKEHHDYTGGLHSLMEGKVTDIRDLFFLLIYSITTLSLKFSIIFHNRESEQPDQSFSNTKAIDDWRRLVSGCSFWGSERAPLLVSCFLWWILLRRGMFGLLPSPWRHTGTLHLRWEWEQGMPGGMAGRLLLWAWVPPIYHLYVWDSEKKHSHSLSWSLCIYVWLWFVCWNLSSNTSPYLSYLCVHVCLMEA